MHTTYAFNRTISQQATLLGCLGAFTIAVVPPLGILLMVLGFLAQRRYTKRRKAAMHRVSYADLERAEQAFILAAKSFR